MADVDLRPMSIGEVLDRTFFLYKKNFWLFAGIMALPFLVLLILRLGLAAIQPGHPGALGTPPRAEEFVSAYGTSYIIGAAIGGFLVFVAALFLAGAAQAATIFAVSDLYLGRPTSVRGVYSRVGKKAWRVLLVLFLVSLCVGIGFLLLIVPGLILLCRTALAVPVAMLEDAPAVRSIERSMELTKGFWAPLFLIFLLVWVLSIVAAMIFTFPFAFMTMYAAAQHHAVSFGLIVLQNLATYVSEVIVGPIGTIAFSLMYYNLRVRKEAFDVQHLIASMESQPIVNPQPAA